MSKNPRTLLIQTPEDDAQPVENVSTWWRDGPDLIVEHTDGNESRFPLGEVIDQ